MAYGYTLTTAGRTLLLQLQAGNSMIMSRIAVGDGEVPEGTNPATLTGLVHEVERSQATCTVPVVEADTLSFEIEYRNKWDVGTFGEDYTDSNGLTESFWLKEYAVFALDASGNEVMLYYANLGDFPEAVAKWNGRNLVSKRYPVSISIVDDDTDVQLAFPARAFITADYLEERLSFVSIASEIGYDNRQSGLESDKVQGAIDEVAHDVAIFSEKLYRQAMTGNVQSYIDWAKEYPHIGNVRVQPLWFGNNTVRVLITDDAGAPASKTLTDCFQFYLDPNCSGLGNGVAPIGVYVTVAPGTARLFDIRAEIQLADGYSQAVGVRKTLERYAENIASINGRVDYEELLSLLQNVSGIAYVSNLLLNESTQPIDLLDDEIPVINEITLEVV